MINHLCLKVKRKFIRNPIAKVATSTAGAKGDEEEEEYEEYEYEDEYYDDEYAQEGAGVAAASTPRPKAQMTREETESFERMVEESFNEQSVLLGVVGVDVPVLRLISKVSPKFQMGVGIYIIMLDNNGFIVYHPSIKRELQNAAVDSKGKLAGISERFNGQEKLFIILMGNENNDFNGE